MPSALTPASDAGGHHFCSLSTAQTRSHTNTREFSRQQLVQSVAPNFIGEHINDVNSVSCVTEKQISLTNNSNSVLDGRKSISANEVGIHNATYSTNVDSLPLIPPTSDFHNLNGSRPYTLPSRYSSNNIVNNNNNNNNEYGNHSNHYLRNINRYAATSYNHYFNQSSSVPYSSGQDCCQFQSNFNEKIEWRRMGGDASTACVDECSNIGDEDHAKGSGVSDAAAGIPAAAVNCSFDDSNLRFCAANFTEDFGASCRTTKVDLMEDSGFGSNGESCIVCSSSDSSSGGTDDVAPAGGNDISEEHGNSCNHSSVITQHRFHDSVSSGTDVSTVNSRPHIPSNSGLPCSRCDVTTLSTFKDHNTTKNDDIPRTSQESRMAVYSSNLSGKNSALQQYAVSPFGANRTGSHPNYNIHSSVQQLSHPGLNHGIKNSSTCANTTVVSCGSGVSSHSGKTADISIVAEGSTASHDDANNLSLSTNSCYNKHPTLRATSIENELESSKRFSGNETNTLNSITDNCDDKEANSKQFESRCGNSGRSAWNSWQEVAESTDSITLDVSRTFPNLCIFQEVLYFFFHVV